MIQWPCEIGAHDACLSSSKSCSCDCHKPKWGYRIWKMWDRLLDKALNCWEIDVSTPDPLRPPPQAPALPPPLAPAAASPVEPVGTPVPGEDRELEYWLAKVREFDFRHPSLLGPL